MNDQSDHERRQDVKMLKILGPGLELFLMMSWLERNPVQGGL